MADINFFDPKRMARFEQEERARQAAARQQPVPQPARPYSKPQAPAPPTEDRGRAGISTSWAQETAEAGTPGTPQTKE